MAGAKTFKDLIVWQKAHQLVLLIYKTTNDFPKSENFGLTLQIRRAVVSVASNIAEGFKRKSSKDSVHFYNMSECSLEEVKYQALLSEDLEYVKKETFNEIEKLADEVGKLLHGWIGSQK